jgi:uncharacterized protein (TIGR02996 family)
MTDTERDLLAAIEAAPGDDAPRLVYADWLDEHDREGEAAELRTWVAGKFWGLPRWKVSLRAHKLHATIPVADELLQDSAFDLSAYLIRCALSIGNPVPTSGARRRRRRKRRRR